MQILIVTPAAAGSTKGNRITAVRWAGLLQQSDHEVHVGQSVVDGNWDCLITLHATRSFDTINLFRQRFPDKPVILCLTGTDLFRDLKGLRGEDSLRRAAASIKLSDRLVLLEPESIAELSAAFQEKAVAILQSAMLVKNRPEPLTDQFEVCVVGHLRAEKDPFLAARAVRLLPEQSRIQISHLGAALTSEYEQQARQEMESNVRYRWLGPLPHLDTQSIIARSRLMILTSKIEGAPSVISEAVVNQVPILATRITATIGLLGSDYPGLFPVSDHEVLAALMDVAETDAGFLAELSSAIEQLIPKFAVEVEQDKLHRLVMSAQQKTTKTD